MKRLVYSFIFASLVGMSSCNDFDVPVTDRLTEEDVWKDETLVTGALANLYDKLQVEQNSAYFEGWDVWNVSLTTASDEGTGAFQAGDLGTGDVVRATFNDEWFGLWADTYKSIRGCNVFLEKLEASAMEEKLKNAYNAEARFLRAFHYFNLVKRYGGVPIVTDVQSYTGPEDLLKSEEVFMTRLLQEMTNSLLPAIKMNTTKTAR